MIRNFLASIGLICVLAVSTAQAELVQVPFDSFNLAAVNANGAGIFGGNNAGAIDTDTYVIGSYTFEREVSTLGSFAIGNALLFDTVIGGQATYTYTITSGGTFGDFFDDYRDGTLGGNPAGATQNPAQLFFPFDGFGIGISSTTADLDIDVTAGGATRSQTVNGAGFYAFHDVAFTPAIDSVAITFSSAGGNNVTFSSFSAVPEPSALLLFGTVLTGIGLNPRRRRSV